MADIPGDLTAEQIHCDAFVRENADPGLRRPAHDLFATPLDALAGRRPEPVAARRTLVAITTRQTSFDVWAALGLLEEMLSDYRRIAPRYRFLQTAGEAGIAAGNEYRLTISDPALLGAINNVIGDAPKPARIDRRDMDVRVVRAGPWGGETGELVVEALRNHALAGASSLWVLAHDDRDDGNLRVTLDAFEIARPAWAPDLLAARRTQGDGAGTRIVDWEYLFERLAQRLEGLPEATDPAESFFVTGSCEEVLRNARVCDALDIHVGLRPYVDRMSR